MTLSKKRSSSKKTMKRSSSKKGKRTRVKGKRTKVNRKRTKVNRKRPRVYKNKSIKTKKRTMKGGVRCAIRIMHDRTYINLNTRFNIDINLDSDIEEVKDEAAGTDYKTLIPTKKVELETIIEKFVISYFTRIGKTGFNINNIIVKRTENSNSRNINVYVSPTNPPSV